ncbi:PREDICTED: ubiquitin-like protein 4A [Camelina sativa]|uniref:Ubiquitin-like protein 4A n=1 Tax=Camelina sativa TaxID=90675 RepID=A0ABM0W8B5_CAMSA|nr:PREDICTED: ubiquitin-like protein 4A [Camelina sativa]
MKLTIETKSGSPFSIFVGFLDTVLMVKQKIETSQGIPVRKQNLFFEGKYLHDQSEIRLRHIGDNSLLFLDVSPDEKPNQKNNDQTKQSPSKPIHGFVNKPFQKITATRIDDGSSRPSYSLVELLAPQDLPPVTVETGSSTRNRNQEVVQTKICSSSDSVKEAVINITPDWPLRKKRKIIPSIKMTVFVKTIDETRMIPVEVNANDKVEELRKELGNLQDKGELNLPQEGYYFILRGRTMIETETFMWNLVADGDTIQLKLFVASSYYLSN